MLELNFCLYLIDLVSYDTKITCFFFLIPGIRFVSYDSFGLTQNPYLLIIP